MYGESGMERRRRTRRHRKVALVTAIAGLSTLSATAGGRLVNAGGNATSDVAEWVDEVDPATVVDQSTDCMAGATDVAFYRGDRIVLRSGMSDADARTAVNNALHWRVRRPERLVGDHRGADRVPAAAVGSGDQAGALGVSQPTARWRPARCRGARSPASARARHRVVARLRPHAVDAVQPRSGPTGYPRPISTLTPPRTNVTARRTASRHRDHDRWCTTLASHHVRPACCPTWPRWRRPTTS